MFGRTVVLAAAVAVMIAVVQAATPAEWSKRTIYQIITDRFALPPNSTTDSSDTVVTGSDGPVPDCVANRYYCGGTWSGILSKLDYIQGMGFDAVWISPIVKNIEPNFHGYAAQNIYLLNQHFGSEQEFQALIAELHRRDMYMMVDVVANHMGIPPNYNYSILTPFNRASDYHSCSNCPSGCNIQDWSDQNQVEICRLSGLPDLDQSQNWVRDTLLQWITGLVGNYSVDGLRIDTVAEVAPDFWADFQAAAGVYAVGEVDNGDTNYVAPYQSVLDATLSYPMYFTLVSVFANQQSMYQLQDQIDADNSLFLNVDLLGTFTDNHDNPRFLSIRNDQTAYKNSLVFVLMSSGIPIVYYGTEQGFDGTNDPFNREELWPTGYATTTPLYKFLTQVVTFRKSQQVWKYEQIQRYADDSFYAFTRGTVFVAMTNVGTGGDTQTRTITYHPYDDGTVLCNCKLMRVWPLSFSRVSFFSLVEADCWVAY